MRIWQQKKRLVHVDECEIKSTCAMTRTFSKKNSNTLIKKKANAKTKKVFIIAAVSEEVGLEGIVTSTKHIDHSSFIQIYPKIL